MDHRCGETPGEGKYACAKCNEEIELEDDSSRLPPCCYCEEIVFRKLN